MFLRGMTKMALCAEITVMNTGGNVVLSPSHQVLVRTEGIQFGLDSARAGIFPAPRELIDALVPILRSLREPRAKGQIISELTSAGLHPVAARGLMEDLLTHGVIRTQGKPHTSAVIGDDPLADAISDLLEKSGMNILRSTNFPSTEEFMDHIQRRTLVIVCNPRGIESGVEDRVNTHGFLLPVRLIDAHGIIGPVRLERSGPCLACSDLHRADSDPEWPVLRTQSILSGRPFLRLRISSQPPPHTPVLWFKAFFHTKTTLTPLTRNLLSPATAFKFLPIPQKSFLAFLLTQRARSAGVVRISGIEPKFPASYCRIFLLSSDRYRKSVVGHLWSLGWPQQ